MENQKRIKVKALLGLKSFSDEILVKGWVRTKRESKNAVFIAMNDGSTVHNIQVVVNPELFREQLLKRVTTGASIAVTGLWVASLGSGQTKELQAKTLKVLGDANPDSYPLQPKRHSLEFLREMAHLRPRTNTMAAILRVRHTAAFAIHQFFNDKGFFYFNSPLLTTSDAEGAGETFKVTTLNLEKIPLDELGKVDYRKDFFEKETNLTVSGQLEGELAALALSEIYTFGPTFRAENSNTKRHLAEFWMVEPEMAFYDLKDSMDLAEEMLKYLVQYTIDHCLDDLTFLEKREIEEQKNMPVAERSEQSLLDRLQFVLASNFKRISYTEAFQILRNSKPNKKRKFQFLVDNWGVDLQSEHERFLVEKHFKKPVIIYDYPKDIKSFYMRLNDDNKTVGAMDVLFPRIGEIIGGSQREERLDLLTKRMKEKRIPSVEMDWFLDTRRFGTVEHSGFGLGFERMILFLTGMSNIRDVIPFPRTPGNCEY
ncbi:MAG: asparagine--tRNA ligase [Flammeovirgaceae bacterium]|nr:asparagine--tRNA ligase [Flammeovirgaceae bacterium]